MPAVSETGNRTSTSPGLLPLIGQNLVGAGRLLVAIIIVSSLNVTSIRQSAFDFRRSSHTESAMVRLCGIILDAESVTRITRNSGLLLSPKPLANGLGSSLLEGKRSGQPMSFTWSNAGHARPRAAEVLQTSRASHLLELIG